MVNVLPAADDSPVVQAPQWIKGNPNDPNTRLNNNSVYLYQDFQKMFGRAPTTAEFNQLQPSYNTDDRSLNLTGGRSQLASYYQQLTNSPQNLYQKQQAQLTESSPKYYDQVNQSFKDLLGRDATDAEKTHFGMLLASGQDPYQVQQALQQTTEFQNKQAKEFTDQLTPQLQSTNADYFSKYIMPAIQAQNAQAGRTQDSSGYQAQLANAGQQQNYDLQNYLAQVRSQGFQGSVANNSQNYQALLGQQYGIQDANISNTLSNQASNQQYNQNLNMYNLQQQAYNNYLRRYGKTSGLGGGISGGLSGAASGAAAGASFGPWGALAGGVIGGGLGAYGGSQSAKL